MNIKSLLLGSAAALVAVSGARAADAVNVVAEPEPAEYVRVCDTYGTGYYYIPGTETCLGLDGHVRFQASFAKGDDGWKTYSQARLNVNAKSETELGTLGGYFRIEGRKYSGGGDGTEDYADYLDLIHAQISLAGFTVGLGDSLYDDDLSWVEGEKVGNYGSTQQISYSFDFGSGFSATIGFEEENWNTDYTPNVVARVGVTQGWGNVNVYVAYEDKDGDDTAEEAFYVKALGQFNVSEQIGIQAIARYESEDRSFYTNGYEWSAGGAVQYKATDKLAIALGGEYYGSKWSNENDDYVISTVVDYTIVPKFNAKLAVAYWDGDSYADEGSWKGFLRFERGF